MKYSLYLASILLLLVLAGCEKEGDLGYNKNDGGLVTPHSYDYGNSLTYIYRYAYSDFIIYNNSGSMQEVRIRFSSTYNNPPTGTFYIEKEEFSIPTFSFGGKSYYTTKNISGHLKITPVLNKNYYYSVSFYITVLADNKTFHLSGNNDNTYYY